jgi:acyl-CoA thioester hydrolase
MSDVWPQLAGRLDGDGHTLPVRIYFEDTDFSGIVYHGSYVRFMERGRTDFLRLAGFGHDALDKGEHGGVAGERLAFTVRRMKIEFRKPARIDDVVEIKTTVRELGGARIELSQIVRRGVETLVTAEVTVALINDAGQPRRLPDRLRERLTKPGAG